MLTSNEHSFKNIIIRHRIRYTISACERYADIQQWTKMADDDI